MTSCSRSNGPRGGVLKLPRASADTEGINATRFSAALGEKMENRFGLEDMGECETCHAESFGRFCEECAEERYQTAEEADTETLSEVEPLRF